MSKWIIGTLLFVVATVTWAQTRKSDPRLQYVGAITINSANPKALSGWYTENLGSIQVRISRALTARSYEIRRFPPRNSSIPAGAKVGTQTSR